MAEFRLAFAGNPNCGKTTLFNALTGSRQRVGNWPGVTIDRKEGNFEYRGQSFVIVDLPGTYSMDTGYSSGLDEAIARDYILSGSSDLVVNVVDATNLERNLFLTTQLIDMRVPMVVALTKMDSARRQGMEIDIDLLSKVLQIPVIPLCPRDTNSLTLFSEKICQASQNPSVSAVSIAYAPAIEAALPALVEQVTPDAAQHWVDPRWLAVKSLGGDSKALSFLDKDSRAAVDAILIHLEQESGEDADLLIADGRYGFANSLARDVIRHVGRLSKSWTERIDAVILNRIFGIPIFLLIMYLMFLLTINFAGAFIDFFDIAAGTVLVDGPAHWLAQWGAPDWVIAMLPNGIGVGIQTVATFIPVVGFLFLFLTCLEDSGYMARAAFVVDRAMCSIGLPGKSFVPMLLGFGCTVPAIMATRTLDSRRDRIVTAMMSPFMSCGARLPVYALFAAAFFANGGQNLVFLLYIIGILFAIFTGLVLKNTIFGGKAQPFVMELPHYHMPNMGSALIRTWDRLKQFCLEAGQLIVIVVFCLSFLNSISPDGSFGHEDSEHSVLAEIGKSLTPVVEPMGISRDNWPATVGLFTGIFAKEAVVGTLNALYSQIDAKLDDGEEDAGFSLLGGLSDAVSTIPANLKDMVGNLADPLGLDIGDISSVEAAAAEQDVDNRTFAAMVSRFDGKVGAFAYLLIILLYTPCVAATAALFREVGRQWALFAIGWTTMLGYCSAVMAYQIGTFSRNPTGATIWIGSILALVVLVIGVMRFIGRHPDRKNGSKPVLEASL
ncbi:Fe(2+) transporter permease subunit FeoB [Cohaesibacter celericrescens]|uniref:Ferrous iron transport protein B n=1 Tax=Cohaesibacter celericrescens TaxID=2067669 RepID=A0A2N5XNY1_9HYPH|nr:Fe(2+) transporter permease subunit FeoB [Cohaesibacter celericrescens]PLW76127.1 ferrous iron transporter B [Cohaesibacter celericrescens]